MQEMTERAIRQVPREIRRQTRVLTAIGETLIDAKIKGIKSQHEAAKRHFKKIRARQKKSGVVQR